jgi:hypothetical protein
VPLVIFDPKKTYQDVLTILVFVERVFVIFHFLLLLCKQIGMSPVLLSSIFLEQIFACASVCFGSTKNIWAEIHLAFWNDFMPSNRPCNFTSLEFLDLLHTEDIFLKLKLTFHAFHSSYSDGKENKKVEKLIK